MSHKARNGISIGPSRRAIFVRSLLPPGHLRHGPCNSCNRHSIRVLTGLLYAFGYMPPRPSEWQAPEAGGEEKANIEAEVILDAGETAR